MDAVTGVNELGLTYMRVSKYAIVKEKSIISRREQYFLPWKRNFKYLLFLESRGNSLILVFQK